MPRLWTADKIRSYQTFTQQFISNYREEIDCADLALASLIEFAYQNGLPVKLKYYSGGWRSYRSSDSPSKDEFRRLILDNMGALNVIDNTRAVELSDAGPGDLIMTRWDSRLGHTRVIYQSTPIATGRGGTDYMIIWYQGNLPPRVPERREALFSSISPVYEGKPRRWDYDSFER